VGNLSLAKQPLSFKLILFFVLIIFVLIFIFNPFKVDFGNTENINIEGNVIELGSLTLQQKISQMIMVRGDKKNFNYNDLNVGGIFLDRQDSEEEYKDLAYGGRVFSGNESEIQEKVLSYIQGLQKNVFGTCKHYPGKSLLKNLHDEKDLQQIEETDLEIFEKCIENNVSSIMVSHQIAKGSLNSNGNPSSVSEEVISSLHDFEGLIIADEINMKGLSLFYPEKIDLYVDLINSGEDFILDFYLSDKQLKNLLEEIEVKVLSGEIDEDKIDKSVKKILKMKGYKIK
jgi:hypothetical protein